MKPNLLHDKRPRDKTTPFFDNDQITIIADDIGKLSKDFTKKVFEHRSIENVRFLESGHLALDWRFSNKEDKLSMTILRWPIGVTSLPNEWLIATEIHKTTDNIYNCIILNEQHEFVQWVMRVRDACISKEFGLNVDRIEALFDLLLDPIRYFGHDIEKLNQYLKNWEKLPNLPIELQPPSVELEKTAFLWRKPDFIPE